MNANNTHTIAPQYGFTLLEVLVAIVIFSIGLMGIAGLQVKGMRFTHDSQLRAIAIAQVETMADRMRADPVGVRLGFYDTKGTMPTVTNTNFLNCFSAKCTSQQLATFTLVTWNNIDAHFPVANPVRESNNLVLPGGDGVVCIDSTPNDGTTGDWKCDGIGNVYVVKVRWTERLADQNDLGKNEANNVSDASNTDEKLVYVRVVPYIPVAGDHIPTTNS